MTPKKVARIKGGFYCIVCDSRFVRRVNVNYHFPGCVRKYGNPLGNSWNDHGSCQDQKELDEAPVNYDPRTIVSDLLRALGEHPTLPPLNAHMEGRRPLHEPHAPASVHPQEHGSSFQTTRPANQQASHLNKPEDETQKKRVEQVTTVAHENFGGGNGGAKRIARTKAVEESTTPNLASPPTMSENQSDYGTFSDTHSASQQGPLQDSWTLRHFNTGVAYFVERSTGIVTVDDPRVVPQPRALTRLGGLPDGWEIRFFSTASSGLRAYFVDHNTRRNTWNDPRRPSL